MSSKNFVKLFSEFVKKIPKTGTDSERFNKLISLHNDIKEMDSLIKETDFYKTSKKQIKKMKKSYIDNTKTKRQRIIVATTFILAKISTCETTEQLTAVIITNIPIINDFIERYKQSKR